MQTAYTRALLNRLVPRHEIGRSGIPAGKKDAGALSVSGPVTPDERLRYSRPAVNILASQISELRQRVS